MKKPGQSVHPQPLVVHESELSDAELAALYAPPTDRAWLRMNFVTSIDGAAEIGGVSAPLSNAADKRVFKTLRDQCDAVVVGAGTFRDEGYGRLKTTPARRAARASRGLAPVPQLVIVSNDLDLDPTSDAFQPPAHKPDEPSQGPIVLTRAQAPAERLAALRPVADVIVTGDDAVDLTAGMHELRKRSLTSLLCEGGPRLFGALATVDLVDEVCLTLSPLLAFTDASRILVASGLGEFDAVEPGPAGANSTPAAEFTLVHVVVAGSTLLTRYTRSAQPTPLTHRTPAAYGKDAL